MEAEPVAATRRVRMRQVTLLSDLPPLKRESPRAFPIPTGDYENDCLLRSFSFQYRYVTSEDTNFDERQSRREATFRVRFSCRMPSQLERICRRGFLVRLSVQRCQHLTDKRLCGPSRNIVVHMFDGHARPLNLSSTQMLADRKATIGFETPQRRLAQSPS